MAVALLAGCQTTDSQGLKKWSDKLPLVGKDKKVKATEYGAPARLVAIWADAVYHQGGRRPARGFGGRLYFYDTKNDAVPVKGQLVVYGYDDSQQGSATAPPSQKFVFTAEQLQEHYTPSELGPSYSIWIPWDEVGGYRKTVTLIPVFLSADGNIASGSPSINLLPGKPAPQQQISQRENPPSGHEQPTRQVVYEQWTEATPTLPTSQQRTAEPPNWEYSRPRIRTTTIQLPRATARRMIEDEAARASAAASLPGSTSEAAQSVAPAGSDTGPGFNSSHPMATEGLPQPPQPRSTRFVRPRYQVPGAERERAGFGRAPTPLAPSAPQPFPPFPQTADRSHAAEGS
jgi:hypothetical protein